MLVKKRQTAVCDSILIPRRYGRRVAIVVIVAVVAAAVTCDRLARGPRQGDDWSRYHDRSFRIARVIDGDTLDIDAPDKDKDVTRIRLWGVDTPEVRHRGRADMHFGPQATDFAKRTLAGREVHVVLSPDRTRGKFGRLLAYVYLERAGRMFNEMLLEEGYAYADLRFSHHYYRQFKVIEQRARKEGRGLWADVTLEKMPQWKQRFERKKASTRSSTGN